MSIVLVKDTSYRKAAIPPDAKHGEFPAAQRRCLSCSGACKQHVRVASVEAFIRKWQSLAHVMGLDLDLRREAIVHWPWRSILRSIDPSSPDRLPQGSFRQKRLYLSLAMPYLKNVRHTALPEEVKRLLGKNTWLFTEEFHVLAVNLVPVLFLVFYHCPQAYRIQLGIACVYIARFFQSATAGSSAWRGLFTFSVCDPLRLVLNV